VKDRIAHEDFIEKIQRTKQVKNHKALPVEIHNYIFKCVIDKKEKERLQKRTTTISENNTQSLLGIYNTLSLHEGVISSQDRLNEASLETYNNQNLEDEVRIEETVETLEDDNNENANPNTLNRDLNSQ